jgi:pyruvate,water dikinase
MEVSKRTGIDLKTLVFSYRSEDVEALLAEKKVLSEKELQEILECSAYVCENGVMRSAVGKNALALEKGTLNHGPASGAPVTELKGTGARPGKVVGRVHILTINDPAATKQFRESFTGGVLVTSMTQPNVVDIARRATAIVTDEGGMLCHAAIISREFGIPCIVGTHKATQVLKDGMEVEVDADKGVVRILGNHE